MYQARHFFALVLLLLVTISLPAQAGIKDRPYSFSLTFGGAQPALNDSAQIWSVSSAYGGQVQYMASQQIGILLSAKYATIYNDSTSTSLLKINRDRANKKWIITDITLGSRLYLRQRKGFSPYLTLAGDLAFWKMTSRADDKTLLTENRSGSSIDYSATEFGVTGGIGFEKLFGDRIGFTLEANLSYLTGANTDFAQSVTNARSRGLATLTAGLWLHFGGKPRNLLKEFEGRDRAEPPRDMRRVYVAEIDRLTGDTIFVEGSRYSDAGSFIPIRQGRIDPEEDSDGDGVRDRFDKYPDTPEGALVDLDGQPHDSDGDGVMDGIDRCPGTPREAWTSIDESGCPLDTDLDGVPDYLDKCPDTSTKAQVDSAGCPIDSDGDGVTDDLDSCPDTPRYVPIDRLRVSRFADHLLHPHFAPNVPRWRSQFHSRCSPDAGFDSGIDADVQRTDGDDFGLHRQYQSGGDQPQSLSRSGGCGTAIPYLERRGKRAPASHRSRGNSFHRH